MITWLRLTCEKDPASSSNERVQIELNAQYIPAGIGKFAVQNSLNSVQVDAITITRARFLIRNVKLRSVPEDSLEFVSDPYIIDLNLDGQPSTITVSDVPANTYDRIDFRIHRLDDDDPRDLAFFQHPDFSDFVTDERYSMIIEGTVQEGTNPAEAFVFRSRDNEKQRHFFDPLLVVNESTGRVTVVFEIKGTDWFVGENGALLDPRDESNENEISDNLQNSIRIIEKKNPNTISDDDYYGDDSY